MTARRILYLGEVRGTCRDRANALRRLGHDVVHLDLREWLPATVWVDRITWRVGGHVFGRWLAREVQQLRESARMLHEDDATRDGAKNTVLRLADEHGRAVRVRPDFGS